MVVRKTKQIVIRHADGESLVWNPRTSACYVVQDGETFLRPLGVEFRTVDEVVADVAKAFGENPSAVRNDVILFYSDLMRQGLVESDEGSLNRFWRIDKERKDSQKIHPSEKEDWDESPLDDFRVRHGIIADFHIDLTDACTERCVHCYVPRGQKHFLDVELVEKALTEFRAVNGLTVHLTGGESMMHPDFERICRKCVELNLNLIIFSNMTLCNEKRIEFLKEIQPQFINVSLYSMDPKVHDVITQVPGSWLKTHDAVVRCCEAGVACRIASPLLKENQDAFPALRKFADAHRLHLVPAADIVAQADHGCGNLTHACLAEELRRVLTRDRELFQKDYDGVMPVADAKVCDIGAARLYLNAKGDYYPCDCMHEYVLGNVRENTIQEIWTGERLNYLRGLKNRDFGSCAMCENRPWCKVCPAANFNATGDLFTHHPGTCVLAGVVREIYGGK